VARRKKNEIPVSFFSFLDIMTSFMGTLMLILISITLVALKMEKKDVLIKIKAEEREEMTKKPIFVECTQDKLVIHPELTETPLDKIEYRDSPFMNLIYTLDRSANYIIFAVRPGGVKTFKRSRKEAEAMGIDIGFEPINQQWNIKLEKKVN
jgi:hypothetical protein